MTIPRTFHLFWDGPAMPAEYAGFADRWLELNPDWTITRWDDQSYQAAFGDSRHIDYYRRPQHWSPKSNIWQWRSDLARYEILWTLGGVWIDADLEPLQPIAPIIDKAEANTGGGAFVAQESPQWINNAFMGCAPGHALLHDMLYHLDNRVRQHRHQRVNRSIGAGYLTPAVRRHPEVLVLPQELVYPFSFNELHRRHEDFPAAFTKHWWNNRIQGEARRRARR